MTYQISISIEAKNDFKQIIEYIDNILKSPSTGDELLNSFKQHLDLISNNPKIYQVLNDEFLALFKVRSFNINPYLVLYIVDEDKKIVNIIGFIHNKRNYQKILFKNLEK